MALLLIWVVPADTEDSTSTAKVDTLLAPEVEVGSDSTQLVPDAGHPHSSTGRACSRIERGVPPAPSLDDLGGMRVPTPMALLAVSVADGVAGTALAPPSLLVSDSCGPRTTSIPAMAPGLTPPPVNSW